MDPKTLSGFYKNRQGKYTKSENTENFLLNMNKALQSQELLQYVKQEIRHPLFFVIGLPRSATTLTTQLLSAGFEAGFINNFVARFWLAPVHGIRLSNIIYGENKKTDFSSDYARTGEITDIHEFGYFWRYWLKKEEISGVTGAKAIESKIDWQGLKTVLANIQNEFDSPMVFKNIFGGYHIEKMTEILDKVVWVYIKRDILDSAVSILEARRKYYTDLGTWWSYMPVEYNLIKDRPYMEQIAGQVYYLKKYYDSYAEKGFKNFIEIEYRDLAHSPASVLKNIAEKCVDLFNYELRISPDIPAGFPFRTYDDRVAEKEQFQKLIEKFASHE